MSERYARQELVFGKTGQAKVEMATIAIVGLGALGTVASELFCRAGIKKLILIDRDIIEESNLQRQTLYSEADVGTPKATAAHKRLKEINSKIKIKAYINDLNFKNIDVLLGKPSLILDCTDNLYTRFLINEYARKEKISWVYAGAIKEHGNVMAILPKTPCFRCLFSQEALLETCETAGVLNTITTAIAALEVETALQILTGQYKEQKLIHLNFSTMHFSALGTAHRKGCPACIGRYEYLAGKKEPRMLAHQCSSLYTFFLTDIHLSTLKKQWEKIGKVAFGKEYLFFRNISVFKNGRVLIKAKTKEDAKTTLAKYIGM